MLKAFQTFMQVDGGGLLLPEMMLVLFAMGILLTDYLLEARDKYFNALMAMLGVIFSGICLWQLRNVADRGAIGFSSSLLVDPFFLFFGFIFLVLQYLQLVRGDSGLASAVSMLPMAAATDPVDPASSVVEDQSSGFFPLGTTVVNVTATDAAGLVGAGKVTRVVVERGDFLVKAR